ncbi:zona pellucida sperm-binding protein 1 [Emys orbicularis]|uniref:zona pellucida sperm-binding protein 1 n=1 Tax=Emys orbicularis TaxID=82168 RepID=UPI0031FBA72C
MGLGCRYFVGLVLLWSVGTVLGQGDFRRVSFSVLQQGYECGDYGMQLLVFPRQGHTVRFKVVDEFGTPFEVTNCSICLHWVTSGEQGVVIFSAGYNGCHVQKKDGLNHLQVRVEELLSTGAIAATRDVTMTCPKPPEHDLTPEETMRPVPQPQPGLPGLVRPVPQPQPGLVRPVPQPQPGLVRPVPQPQPGLVRPVPHIYPPPRNMGAHLTQEQCRVVTGKIPCRDALGRAACSQAGCCYDETDPTTPCYYGNTVTVQCLVDGHFVLVVSRDMSDHPIILDSVRLAYAQTGCDPIRMTEAFVIFRRFPVMQCGTTVQVIGDKLIYENQLISSIDVQTGPDGSITRDSTFIVHARCIYNASDFLPVQVEVFLPPTPAPVTQAGPLQLELRIATDLSYRSYLTERDYPVVKVLRDPIYMEVRILQRTDPNLVLSLHHCWATPSANPLEQPQWPILVDGCPFLGDNYRTQLVPIGSELPFPTHHQCFVLSTFAFVDSASQIALDGEVYLFCSASACRPSQLELCRTMCPSRAAIRGRRFLHIGNGTRELQDLEKGLDDKIPKTP